MLCYSEDKNLESAVVRIINPEDRCDGNLELLESSSSIVAKEILQEAPELITQQLAHLFRGERLLFILNTERFNGVFLNLLMQRDSDSFFG